MLIFTLLARLFFHADARSFARSLDTMPPLQITHIPPYNERSAR